MNPVWATVVVAQSVLLVAVAVVLVGILRRVLPLLERQSGGTAPLDVRPGDPAPWFRAALVDGSTVTSDSLAGRPVLLLFVSGSCRPCRRLLAELGDGFAGTGPAGPTVYAVHDPGRHATPRLPAGVTSLPDPGGRVLRAFGVHATPLAVAIDARGVVAGAEAPGDAAAVYRLLHHLRQEPPERGAPVLPAARATTHGRP